jgi:hypothetical protein
MLIMKFKIYANASRKIFRSVLIFCILSFALSGCFTNFIKYEDKKEYRDEITRKAEEKIRTDVSLREFDLLCNEVPIMQGFEYIGKDITKRKKSVGVYYHSLTEQKVNFANLKSFYTSQLEERGWKPIADYEFGSKWIEFKKEDKYIMISTAPDSGMDYGMTYAISCSDNSYSNPE